MNYVSDANEIERKLRAWAYNPAAPAVVAEKIQVMTGVQADRLPAEAEILYAHRDLLDDDALRVMGELFIYAREHGWTTFNRGDRTDRIVALVRRDLGEKGSGVAAKNAEWPEPELVRREGGVDWRNPPKGDDDAPEAKD